MGLKIATENDFLENYKDSDVLAVAQTISSDYQTSIGIADRFVDEDNFFLLESATQGAGSVARYSFLGKGAIAELVVQDNGDIRVISPDSDKLDRTLTSGPVASVSEFLQNLKVSYCGSSGIGVDTDLFLKSGAFGYLSYDIASHLEPAVGRQPPKKIGIPDGHFFIPRDFLVFDQLSQNLHVFRYIDVSRIENDEQALLVYKDEIEGLSELVGSLKKAHIPPELLFSEAAFNFDEFKSEVSETVFLKRVERCLEEVRNGEVFQIQIGNRISKETSARPFDLFRHLRKLNPSPYMFFYKFKSHHIIGSSPEMMVTLENRKITHRPIAGTRKRTWSDSKDVEMIHELTSSDKERAEHIMLVDLGRNDIGRVAEPGSVEVEELMTVEKYSHVFHMVSQVSGQVEKGFTAADAMIASFPNGTVVGAPKIRAMQLIAEIEEFSREFYAGSLGVFQFDGNLKSTLLIRTLHVAGGVASTQASAGVVYDSVPKEEWLETKNKMAACGVVIQNTK
jgi:anthranilate synthase component I